MKFILNLILLVICVFAELLPIDEAFKIEAKFIPNTGVEFDFDLDKSSYLYADKMEFYLKNEKINEMLNLPQISTHKNHEIYKDKFKILIPLGLIMANGNSDNFDILLNFSACTFAGFCYPPKSYKFSTSKKMGKIIISKTEQKPQNKAPSIQAKEQKIASFFENKNAFLVILIFFGYGLLMSLTPCVFPMIPILSSILAFKVSKTGNSNVKSAFFLSLVYVLAMALAYALIGAITGVFGFNLNRTFQNPYVSGFISLLFVLFALNMFGVFEINLPSSLQNKLSSKLQKKGGLVAVVLMGVISALIVGPCIAAPLAGALIYIANSGNALFGFVSLFVMGLGMGVPLLIIGAGFGLPKPGGWMNEIRLIFGFLMLIMAVYFSNWVIGKNLALLFYGIIGVFFGAYFWGEAKFKKAISILAIIYSTILITGFANGATSIAKPLVFSKISKSEFEIEKLANLSELKAKISKENKPIILDFWASWCTNCEEISASLESADLSGVILLQVDMTNTNAEISAILDEYKVFNPPTILFFKNGEELSNLRVVGEISRQNLHSIINSLQK